MGLGPVGVVGAFDVPFGHLAFDDAGCGADPSGGVESAEQPGQETLPEAVVGVGVLRGKSALVGEGLAGDPHAATKLTRSGSWPEWVAASAIRERIA